MRKQPPDVITGDGPERCDGSKSDLDGDAHDWRLVLHMRMKPRGRVLPRETHRGVDLLLREFRGADISAGFDHCVNTARARVALLAGRHLLRGENYPMMRSAEGDHFVCTLIPGKYVVECEGQCHYLWWHGADPYTCDHDRPAHEPEVQRLVDMYTPPPPRRTATKRQSLVRQGVHCAEFV